MISSNVFRFLAVAGSLGLGALASPAQAAVFQASTPVSLLESFPGYYATAPFSLPQYSGPGRIVRVNIAFSGSASGGDYYDYFPTEGITVESYSRTWSFALVGPPNPNGPPFGDVDVTAEYQGGSIPPCLGLPGCGLFTAVAGPVAFSGSVDVSDFSDYAGSGSSAFLLVAGGLGDVAEVSATVTETMTVVPEPSTWAMMFIGLAIVGFAARSRHLAKASRHVRLTNEAV
jgi:hypothetical protein